ncbi:MAG: glycosyltransferase family 2 protein [Bacteriovoracaceae bacterium]
MKKYFHQVIASEISQFSQFYNKTWRLYPVSQDYDLNQDIKCAKKGTIQTESEFLQIEDGDLILLDGNLNYNEDIQEFLTSIGKRLGRHSRLTIVLYNSYLKVFYRLASFLKLRSGALPSVFLTKVNLENLCRLSGYELVRLKSTVYLPFYIPIISNLVNSILPMIPWLRNFSFAQIAVLRPIIIEKTPPSISIIIPARNEKDNIRSAIQRIPQFLTNNIEIIFVEGNSTDDTWNEIQKCVEDYKGHLKLSYYKQTGKGKKDAVDVGFANATGDILTILDADLTMPPENLVQFYNAYVCGLGDFINGNRLFYPMENKAMRPLNLLGNIFFAKSLSFVLGEELADTLCGTKLFSRKHYLMMLGWNKNFGSFDPFGDFEMIFPSAVLGMGVVNVPIKYRNRTYGETNIQRFYHGLMLFKMTLIGLLRIKLGKT